MCQAPHHNEEGLLAIDKKYRLADFFDLNWDAYVKSPSEYIAPEQFKAVAAMRVCRTEALGVDHYACPECGEVSQVYHSCKNRFCPTCSWKDTLQWAEKMESQMMDIPHRHVVFTLPHQLNNLIKDNKAQLLGFLFKAAAESIMDWMQHKYNLKPGVINVLHTFGEKKDFHCHIHMILSWGGVNKNHWIEQIKGDYVNFEFIQTKFRCLFEDKLVKLFDSKALENRFEGRLDFLRFLKRINQKNWCVHFEASMETPSEVIRYIGRYTKRACLSEYKITNIEGENITFKYKDYKNLDINGKPIVKELTLHYTEFFPRLLQHVPIPYFRLVRYYGVYAARSKAILKSCYKDHQPEPVVEQVEEECYEMAENPKHCKTCDVAKIYVHTTFRNRNKELVYMSRFNPSTTKLKTMAA
jgi:hypothetical protein